MDPAGSALTQTRLDFVPARLQYVAEDAIPGPPEIHPLTYPYRAIVYQIIPVIYWTHPVS